jgi:hypothetical protein
MAATTGCGWIHGRAGRALPRSRLTAARPPIGGRVPARGPMAAPSSSRRSTGRRLDVLWRTGRALPRSCSIVVRPPIGGRARRRQGPRRCHRGVARHGRGSGENDWVLGFGPGRRRRFCSVGFHAWPLDADGRLMMSGPNDTAQVGKRFPGPGPRRGLVCRVRCARAGRRTVFCFGPVSSYEQ